MMKWLEDIGLKARVEAKALLQYVISVEGLAGVREVLYQILGLARISWNMVGLSVGYFIQAASYREGSRTSCPQSE